VAESEMRPPEEIAAEVLQIVKSRFPYLY